MRVHARDAKRAKFFDQAKLCLLCVLCVKMHWLANSFTLENDLLFVHQVKDGKDAYRD